MPSNVIPNKKFKKNMYLKNVLTPPELASIRISNGTFAATEKYKRSENVNTNLSF